jgi:hypothetical protein
MVESDIQSKVVGGEMWNRSQRQSGKLQGEDKNGIRQETEQSRATES